MTQVIDRRLSGKNKSAVNRQRFIRRFKAQIKRAVADAVAGRSIVDIDNGEKINIPARDMSEPVFQHGRGGRREAVHPGNTDFVTGDRIKRPPDAAGGQGGGASNSGEGEDEFAFQLSRRISACHHSKTSPKARPTNACSSSNPWAWTARAWAAIFSTTTRTRSDAIATAELLEAEGISVTVADARFAKPLDTDLVERLILALLCNGHVLIEGIPGLAKTLSVTTLARTIRAGFQRIQFTPDLLPSDITGFNIYDRNSGEFKFQSGPVMANILLADLGEREQARDTAERCIAVAPNNVRCLSLLGSLQLVSSEYNLCARTLDRAIEAGSTNALDYQYAGTCYIVIDDCARAREILLEGMALAQTVETQTNIRDALAQCQTIVTLVPTPTSEPLYDEAAEGIIDLTATPEAGE